MNFEPILRSAPVTTSVPCRVDFGGTLDISTFFMPLAHKGPGTLNLALDMRTRVSLSPWDTGRIKVSSRGFDAIERSAGDKGLDNPMGLIFAIAQYFNAQGVHIRIDSASPPRSALGGSSSAAVAVIAAFYSALAQSGRSGFRPDQNRAQGAMDPEHLAWLAHYIESSVAGVPCGVQDQAAAAFGGANFWEWTFGRTGPKFVRRPLYGAPQDLEGLNRHILVAYCGIPHESKDVNSKWVAAFKSGSAVKSFEKIADSTREFTRALKSKDFSLAAQLMNRETRERCKLTPEVLDKTGKKLFERAKDKNCGARFTGAGGGGCLWAVGESDRIRALKGDWQKILADIPGACILDTSIDPLGIKVH